MPDHSCVHDSQVTELLYTKQTQLERLAAEKAAQQLAHERQIAHAKDDAERVKRYSCHRLPPGPACCLHPGPGICSLVAPWVVV